MAKGNDNSVVMIRKMEKWRVKTVKQLWVDARRPELVLWYARHPDAVADLVKRAQWNLEHTFENEAVDKT